MLFVFLHLLLIPTSCGYKRLHVMPCLCGTHLFSCHPQDVTSQYSTVSVESYHQFRTQKTQAWLSHSFQPSLLALELDTLCSPLSHTCQAHPPRSRSPSSLLTQRQACGRTWRSSRNPSLHVVAEGGGCSPGSRYCLPHLHHRDLVERNPGDSHWSMREASLSPSPNHRLPLGKRFSSTLMGIF